jgi:hypothetical protein
MDAYADEFLAAVEMELRLRGAAFDRGELQEWCHCLGAPQGDPADAAQWADAFLEAQQSGERQAVG